MRSHGNSWAQPAPRYQAMGQTRARRATQRHGGEQSYQEDWNSARNLKLVTLSVFSMARCSHGAGWCQTVTDGEEGGLPALGVQFNGGGRHVEAQGWPRHGDHLWVAGSQFQDSRPECWGRMTLEPWEDRMLIMVRSSSAVYGWAVRLSPEPCTPWLLIPKRRSLSRVSKS